MGKALAITARMIKNQPDKRDKDKVRAINSMGFGADGSGVGKHGRCKWTSA